MAGRREIEVAKGDHFHRTLTANISRHLQHLFGWTKFLAGLQAFDWDRVDYPYERILSENSSPTHWRHIIEAVSSYIDDPQGALTSRDLLGIIVLHGTDTMAQVVPAIQWGIDAQHVPIVFVGSNYPLSVDAEEQLRLSRLRSDAWPNILVAVGFCALARSIPPQVLLSFGRCIHQALNLKKINESAIASVEPAGPSPAELKHIGDDRTRAREPYIYHNVLSNTKYLARLIAGDFVFAETPFVSRVVPDPKAAAIRFHEDAFGSSEDVVAHLSASSLPPALEKHELGRYRTLLIETYESGTIPTGNDHRFCRTLQLISKARMPVFLSSHYRIDLHQLYECKALEDLRIPVYRIDNLVPETALPLLRLACERVDRQKPGLHGEALGNAIRAEILSIVAITHHRTSQLVNCTQIVRTDEEAPRA